MQGTSLQRIVEPLSAAFATADRLTIVGPCKIKRFGCIVIGTAGTTTAIVIKADGIIQGATRGNGDKGVCTAPSVTQSVGQMIYKDVNVDLAIGDVVVLEITTAMGGSGAGVVFADTEPYGFHPNSATLDKASA